MREQKLRKLLCENCIKKIREYERKYRNENKENIKKVRHKHYIEKEKGNRKGSGKYIPKMDEETKQRLRKVLDSVKDEEIWE